MSVGRNAEDQPILVVNDVQKEFESLEKTFEGMLRAVQESQSEDADASLQHVLLLASGVEEASEAIKVAVQQAKAVCSCVLQLNSQLRGTDKLAEQAKQLKGRVRSMEIMLDNALGS